jgi:hypothetical protein
MKTNSNNNLKPFDSLFINHLLPVVNTLTPIDEAESKLVLEKNFEIKMSEGKVSEMLSMLYKDLSKDTLGSLVSKAITSQDISELELGQKTGLTPSLITAIKSDMVFTNSIPVRSLTRLIKVLNLSIEAIQEALKTTFDKLSQESRLFFSVPTNIQPSFRSGSSDHLSSDRTKRPDESYLYQNKEALDKYTNRLLELYKEF